DVFLGQARARVIGEADAKLAAGPAEELVGVEVEVEAEEGVFAKAPPARVNKRELGAWRSLASATEWVQEVAGSDPAGPTGEGGLHHYGRTSPFFVFVALSFRMSTRKFWSRIGGRKAAESRWFYRRPNRVVKAKVLPRPGSRSNFFKYL